MDDSPYLVEIIGSGVRYNSELFNIDEIAAAMSFRMRLAND
jgi:hypothetical protein